MASSLATTHQNLSRFGDIAFKGIGDLIKLLPSGTVFLFLFLSPLLTNNGRCSNLNHYLSASLLTICAFSCAFSTFTDSYVGPDGRPNYGIATRAGMWVFSGPDKAGEDLAKYRLRGGDFVHAALAVAVFGAVALLDGDTVRCFYPGAVAEEGMLVKVVPAAVGAVASGVFVVFPNERHGIGYPPVTLPEEK